MSPWHDGGHCSCWHQWHDGRAARGRRRHGHSSTRDPILESYSGTSERAMRRPRPAGRDAAHATHAAGPPGACAAALAQQRARCAQLAELRLQ